MLYRPQITKPVVFGNKKKNLIFGRSCISKYINLCYSIITVVLDTALVANVAFSMTLFRWREV